MRFPALTIFKLTLHRRWLAIALMIFALPALAADNTAAFEAANKLYEQGKYVEAVTAYDALLKGGEKSAAVHFNLGNAHFKAGQIGLAIAHYRAAQELAPRDPDIRANLQFARDHVAGGQAEPVELWRRAVNTLTLNEWSTLAMIALWGWLVLLTLARWQPRLRNSLRGYTATIGVVGFLLAGVLVLAAQQRWGNRVAVIIVPEAVVRFGPLEESQSAFTARDGTELQVLDAKSGWLQVGDAQGRLGWVPEKFVTTAR